MALIAEDASQADATDARIIEFANQRFEQLVV